ncbi:MAG: hypothetical protein IH618_13510 [Ignavibacteriaceae bacterium]|nr:hypothetical protein [Ignavibacteriaceae bacterium]
MKFFIDIVNVNEIKEAAALGIHDGVTTNPSLVSKEGKDFRKLLDDISTSGMALISQIVQIYKNYNCKTQVLLASVRHPLHVVESALIGVDVCTIPFDVIKKMFNHPLTDIGLEKFLSDWKKLKK